MGEIGKGKTKNLEINLPNQIQQQKGALIRLLKEEVEMDNIQLIMRMDHGNSTGDLVKIMDIFHVRM